MTNDQGFESAQGLPPQVAILITKNPELTLHTRYPWLLSWHHNVLPPEEGMLI